MTTHTVNKPLTHWPWCEQSLIQMLLVTWSTRWRGRVIFLCASSRHCSFMASRAESAHDVLPVICTHRHIFQLYCKGTILYGAAVLLRNPQASSGTQCA